MRNMNGVHCQTSTATTESMARRGDDVQVNADVFNPIPFRVPFTAPKLGFSINRQTTPATTVGNIMGTKSAARKKLRPRSWLFINTARPSPNKNSRVSAEAAYKSV